MLISCASATYIHEKQVAIAAVRMAAKLCQQVRHQCVDLDAAQNLAIAKSDYSPVTVADFGAQAIICQAISAAFPCDPIVAEEDAEVLRSPDMIKLLSISTQYIQSQIHAATSEQVIEWISRGNGNVSSRYWTLDPIDGTKGFLRGDQYAIALSLIEGGEVKVGILACPNYKISSDKKGALFVAVRGQGATIQPLYREETQPLQVTDYSNPDLWRMVESLEHGDTRLQNILASAIGIHHPSIRMDSQAKYAAVASGSAVLYLRLPSPKTPNYREKIWDHAAGLLIVEEAGGCVTDMYGASLDFLQGSQLTLNRGVVVSNKLIHQTLLDVLKHVEQEKL